MRRILTVIVLAYLSVGCASGVDFIRQNNSGYTTQTRGSYLCDTGIRVIQDWVDRPGSEYANLYIVYRYPEPNKKWSLMGEDNLDRAIIVAFDINKDGIYDALWFDTDGNGKFDMFLEGGQAKEDGVLWLYCQYQQLEMS